MSRTSRVAFLISCLTLCMVLIPGICRRAEAQDCPSCLPDYEVQVTPDGSAVTKPSSGTYTAVFTVKNTGTNPDSYDLICAASGVLQCVSVSQTPISLDPNEQTNITVTYTASSAGVNTLSLSAGSVEGFGHFVSDDGSYTVTVNGPGAPVISTAPQNASYRDVSKCIASCFDGTYSHSSPAYVSLGVPRGFSLAYNSATHKPRPVVWVDVSENAQTTADPTNYSIQIKNLNTGTFITQLNSSTITYYTRNAGDSTRVAAIFDAQANSITTGRTPIEVTITSYYSGGPTLATTATTYVVITDQSGSALGAGMSLAGYQRMKIQAGGYAISEGDGSVVFYHALGKGNTPLGSTAWLTYDAGTTTYTRTYLDASYLQFNSAGRMTKSSDRFGNATNYAYYTAPYDSLLSTITDPMGKVIRLCYNAGCTATNAKLHHVDVLYGGGFVTRTVNYLYDGSGRLIRALDPDSYSDSLAYGANGILSKVYDRARQVTDLTYDAMHRLQTVQAPSIALYDGSNGRPTVNLVPSERTVWQPAITGTTLGTSKAGVKGDSSLKALIIGSNADTTKFALDQFGAPIKITDTYGATTRITRDGHSRPTRVDEPDTHFVTIAYNFRDQVISVTDGYSGSQTFTYRDTLTTDIATISGGPERLDFLYYTGGDGGPAGALKREFIGNTAVWPALSNARLIAYHRPDSRGRDTTVIDSLGHAVHYQFEATWGNLWKSIDPTGSLTRLTYDGAGRNDSTIAPLVGKSWVTYGTMNQVLTQLSPGYKATMSYDPATLAQTRVQTPRPGGTSSPVVYKFGYNAVGALIAAHDAADTSKVDSLRYDLSGNVRAVKTRNNETITMTYDRLGRLLTRSGPDFPPEYFKYDTTANKWQYDSSSVTVNFDSLDQKGRLVKWVQRFDSARVYTGTLTYDAFDRVIRRSLRRTVPGTDSSVMTYTYQVPSPTRDVMCAFGRCLTLFRNGDGLVNTSVFNYGGYQSTEWQIAHSYDADHRISSQDFAVGASPYLDGFDISLAYDSISRVKNRTSPVPGYARRVFAYDSLSRLLSACDSVSGVAGCVNVGGVNAWTYDSAGNRAQTGTSSSYGVGNRLLSFGTTNFFYDSLGAIVCRIVGTCPGTGTGYKYSFDALGRLREIRNGSTNALIDSMYYDARGRRVRKTMTSSSERYVYEGSQVILDINNANDSVKREYAWYPGAVDQLFAMRTTTDTLAALIDPRLGTIRGLARFRTGALVKKYVEAPWGDAVADTGLVFRHRFAGREFDQESGLYYNRARYYDPKLGRFISEDPIGIVGGQNLYAYAGNDPVNTADPFGLDPSCWYEFVPGWAEWVNVPLFGRFWVEFIPPSWQKVCEASLPAGRTGAGAEGTKNGGGTGGPHAAKRACSASGGRVQALGLTGAVVGPAGVIHEDGAYSDGRVAGLYETDGVAIGYGAGAGVTWSTSTSPTAFSGNSKGVCAGMSVLTVCRTGNSAGHTWSLTVGVSTPVSFYRVWQKTEVVEVDACASQP